MKKLILILLFVSTLLNAQFLELMQKGSEPELNTNVSLDISYTELITNGTFNDGTGWTVQSMWNINSSLAGQAYYNGNTNGFMSIAANSTVNDIYNVRFSITNSAGDSKLAFAIQTGQELFGEMSTYVTFPDGDYNYVRTIAFTGNEVRAYSIATGDAFGFDNFSMKKLIAPTGFTTPTMTATDYVIEDSGCKLVEATGETYIQMSDTLDAGYYKLKVTQDWTQGKLWAYNGTTTYNFPQADGEYTVKIYLPGNKPLVIGCDNNTISVLSSLSIK